MMRPIPADDALQEFYQQTEEQLRWFMSDNLFWHDIAYWSDGIEYRIGDVSKELCLAEIADSLIMCLAVDE